MNQRGRFSILTGLVGLAACSSSATIPERTETSLSAAGGTAMSAAGELVLRVPAGTLPDGTKVIIVTERSSSISGAIGPVFALSTEPTVSRFSPAIAIELKNPQVAREVRIANLDGAAPVLVTAAAYDGTTGVARGQLEHFSRYGLVGFLEGEDDAGVDGGVAEDPDGEVLDVPVGDAPSLDAVPPDALPQPDGGPLDATPLDADESADADETPDAVPLDASAPDAAPAVDVGPRTWTSTSVGGGTDTDVNVNIAWGPSGPRIVHSMEYGDMAYVYAPGGVWMTSNIILESQPACNSGCDAYASIAVDSSDVLHVAYRGLSSVTAIRPGHSYESIIRYRTITGTVPSAPLTFETIPESPDFASLSYFYEVAPGLALEASGTAHIIYRASGDATSTLRHVTISGGVASAPVTIPNSTTNRALASSVRTGALVAGVDASGTITVFLETDTGAQVLRRVGGTWQAPASLPLSGPITSATVDHAGTVHLIGANVPSTAMAYVTISPAGVPTAHASIPATTCLQAAAALAVDPGNGPAVVCMPPSYRRTLPYFVQFTRFTGGAWSAPERIDYPTPKGYAEGVTPSLVFDSAGNPHVAFQAWGFDDDLIYATYQ